MMQIHSQRLKLRKERKQMIVLRETKDRIVITSESWIAISPDEWAMLDEELRNKLGMSKSNPKTPELIRSVYKNSKPSITLWNEETETAEPYDSAYLREILNLKE